MGGQESRIYLLRRYDTVIVSGNNDNKSLYILHRLKRPLAELGKCRENGTKELLPPHLNRCLRPSCPGGSSVVH